MKSVSFPLLLALMVSAPALAQEDISKVNGSITAQSGQTYGDLDTVNGSIRIEEGAVTGDIETVNGGIRIADHARTGSISTVNGSIQIGREVVASGDVETVNGSIFADRGSQIEGGVDTVNGSIGLVDTRLGEGIETVNGDITVGVGSQVGGGIRVKKASFNLSLTPGRKPRVIIGPNAVVGGTLQFDRDVTLYIHRSARTGAISGAVAQAFDTDAAPQD
ncbi:hypothetical protein ACLB90_11560 [Stenotrophomonas sp. LGBM10]|uniref:hypothetical protein n=1 Tax=Stenotrophomonas sp. LGBM10 TaxID=3390038 RepID=UPI00398BA7E6